MRLISQSRYHIRIFSSLSKLSRCFVTFDKMLLIYYIFPYGSSQWHALKWKGEVRRYVAYIFLRRLSSYTFILPLIIRRDGRLSLLVVNQIYGGEIARATLLYFWTLGLNIMYFCPASWNSRELKMREEFKSLLRFKNLEI